MSTERMLTKESNNIDFSKGNIVVNSNVHFNVDSAPRVGLLMPILYEGCRGP